MRAAALLARPDQVWASLLGSGRPTSVDGGERTDTLVASWAQRVHARAGDACETHARSPKPHKTHAVQAQARLLNHRYELGQLLGEGGFGSVYAAYDHTRRLHCAVKILSAAAAFAPSLRGRFMREAEIVASLSHPNIVNIIEVGLDQATGVPFIAMERLDGSDLWQYVGAYGVLAPVQAAFVLQGVASAINHAHQAQVVHRDLKPPNVFVTRGASGPIVKVLDFGLAKRTQHDTKNSAALGTPGWMAPEQLGNGDVGPTTDVWSFGLLSFFLLAGREYWIGANGQAGDLLQVSAELFAFQNREPPSVRARRFNISWALDGSGYDDWFASSIAWRPDERFASMASAANALFHVLGEAGVPAHFLTLEPLGLTTPQGSAAPTGDAPTVALATTAAAPNPQSSGVRALTSEENRRAAQDQTAPTSDDLLVAAAVTELHARERGIDLARLRAEVKAHQEWVHATRPVDGAANAAPAPAAAPPPQPATVAGVAPAPPGFPPVVGHAYAPPVNGDFEYGRVKVDVAARALVIPGIRIPGSALGQLVKQAEYPYGSMAIVAGVSGILVLLLTVTSGWLLDWIADTERSWPLSIRLPPLMLGAGLLVVAARLARRVTRVIVVLTSGEPVTLPDINENQVADQCIRALDKIRGGP